MRMRTYSRIAAVALIFLFATLFIHSVMEQPAYEGEREAESRDVLMDEVRQLQGEVIHAQGEIESLRMELKKERLIHQTQEPRPSQTQTPRSEPKPTQFAYDGLPHNALLDNNLTTNNVYYIWCGRRWFEFNHYLSIKSVIRLLRPDNIIFYYDAYPIVDSWTYNTFFEELRQEFPFIRLNHFETPEEASLGCQGFKKPNLTFIHHLLNRNGGLYINENTILTDFPLEDRKRKFVFGLNVNNMHGFLKIRRGALNKPISDMTKTLSNDTKTVKCIAQAAYDQDGDRSQCVNTKLFFPKDLWELDTPFGRLCRKIFYGDPQIKLPSQDFNELIPNIAHMVWIGGGEIDFLFFLSVLSLIYVAKVDMVYIHGDSPPKGPYWERVKDNPKLRQIYRETPGTVFGTNVNVLSHVTDVWRVDFMVKYGGIYIDTDAVFVKPLDRDIRAYDAVGSYDWTYWNHPFPDSINFGVAIGKRNAKYWHLFQESMKWFMDKDWSWNGLRQPYRIKERHPELVKIDPHLQVICFESKCHPTWYPDYHNESRHHLNSNVINNWREDVYAFHWTMPTPFELLHEKNLISSTTMFAEIGKFILSEAGLYDTLLKEINAKYNR